MLKGVYLESESLGKDALNISGLMSLPIDWQIYAATQPHQVRERIVGADIVVTNKAFIGPEQLDAAPDLRLIAICATGTNAVDLEEAKRRNVAVSNATGYGTASVAQHTFALILALTTRLIDYNRDVLNGRWGESEQFCRMDYPVTELVGKTIGIIGYGELGQAVAKLARAFGMIVKVAKLPGRNRVIGSEERLPLTELLPTADILSIHCPLTPDTRDLIDSEQLAQMKPSSLLINTARGGIVNEAALAQALKSGEIAGAGLDVLTTEPPREGNILIDSSLPNLIVTPHNAWVSREARQRLIDQVAENIRLFLADQPQNLV